MPGGQPCCSRQSNVQRVEVSAFAAEVAGLQHEPDIAASAASNLRIAKRILDHPFVDRARLVEIGGGSLGRLLSRLLDDAIGRHKLARLEEIIQLRARFMRVMCRRSQINSVAPERYTA